MLNKKDFPKYLIKLRSNVGLTQKDLAEKAGLSQSAIQHYEHGKRLPRPQARFKLASALGVDYSDINRMKDPFIEPPVIPKNELRSCILNGEIYIHKNDILNHYAEAFENFYILLKG